jgi:tight adherence protein B
LTDGRYSPAASADLTAVYENLAKEIANQYLLSYKSAAEGGKNVSIRVTVGTATDTSLVLTPRQPIPPPVAKPTATPAAPILRGTTGLVLALGLSFLAIFAVAVMFLGPAARARRERELSSRVAPVPGGSESVTQSDGENIVATYAPSLAAAGKRLAEATGVTASLEQKLERAGIPLSPGEFLAAGALGVLIGGIAGLLLLQSALFMLIFAAVGGASPMIYLTLATQRRLKRLHGQLPDILMILASSIRAGHSFLQALDTVSKEVGEPGGKEFARALAEIRLGRPLDEALNAMAERIGSDDFKWAVLAVNIQRDVGGNLAEVLDTVAETVREREQIRRQINVLSAEGKLSMYILIALPVLIALWLFKVNPDYIGLLFKERIGIIMVITSVSLLFLGILWMRKIVKIDV